MKAMIFAAGLGTRLKPFTDSRPKALVSVGGKPLLQHVIEKLKSAGYDEIILNVHHFADQIIDFVKANHSFGIRVEFSDERAKLLDTGGGIKKASHFFDDNKPFLLHNVDILSNLDLKKFIEICAPVLHTDSEPVAHASPTGKKPLATLVCSERKTSRYLLFDADNCLKGWTNEQTGETKSPLPHFNPQKYRKLAFAGIQLMDPAIFRYMDSFPDQFSIIDFYLSICDQVTLGSYVPVGFKMIDVGKTGSLKEAEQRLRQLVAP